MKHAINAGMILAVAVSLVSAVLIGSGFYAANLMVSQLLSIGLFIALNVGAVIWALRATSAESGYGGQLLNAIVLGVSAAVVIAGLSWLMLSVVFADAIPDIQDAAIALIGNSAAPEEVRQAQIESVESMTPMSQSIAGGIGTLATSIVVGAIAAIWLRRK